MKESDGQTLLPEEFAELEQYAGWAHGSEPDRMYARETATMERLDQFYHAVLPRLPDIVKRLNKNWPGPFDEREQRLLNLALMLNEASVAVERYRQPKVVNGGERRRYYPEHVAG